MFLAPDGDEIEIANAAADFLAGTLPIARLHGSAGADLPVSTRKSFGEMGWFGLALSEQDGGSGLSAVEHALFFREVGRQCGPTEVLAQSLAVGVVRNDTLRGELLSGETGVALAIADGDAFRLLGASTTEYALCVNRVNAQLARLGGREMAERPALDPVNSMHLFGSGAVMEDIVAESESDRFWRMGQLGAAAMLVGIAEAALDLIVEYAKVRETFGRKIGAYQAVRHPCADMALRTETARCQLWYAAAAMKEERTDIETHLDAAKHLANQAALANADTNIQLHGGIGVTDEHHAHLFLKHAMVLSKLFGSKRMLLSRLVGAEVED